MELRTSEAALSAEAETALPRVLSDLYADRLRSGSFVELDGRRFFRLSDPAGKPIELRLDTAALPRPLVARSFTNTTTDRYVIQLADTLPTERAGQVLAREVAEVLAVRDRAAAGGRVPLEDLLAAGAAVPARPKLSDADRGRLGEFGYLAARMNDDGLSAAQRHEARALFSTLVDDSGLRPVAPADDVRGRAEERFAVAVRLRIVRRHLVEAARTALAELALPMEQLSPADAAALADVRAARAARGRAPESAPGAFPMPGLRSDGTPVPREELGSAAAAAARQRTELSSRTLAALREQQATLPEGRYPEFPIMIGGGAALAGRDPDALLVDARGRWHVDPITAIVQSADQVRHLRQSGFGDPYQFADAQERVPLPAIRLWEDTAAARGPLIDGRAELSVSPQGRLIAEIVPADGSAPVKVEVQGSPLIATGIPPEIVPGANRQVPTVREATDVLAQSLAEVGTPEATAAGERLRALPEGEGRAAAVLEVLAQQPVSEALRVGEETRGSAPTEKIAGATETLRAIAAWEQARALAPGRVFMGDEVGDGDYDPFAATDWVIAGVGGAAIANAEIILEANPEARVHMVGKDAPFVLHNDAQYTALRRKHDAEWDGDGRLTTYSGRYLGAVGTLPSSGEGGAVRLAALDSAGNPTGVEGDAYVACLGRISRLPTALDAVEAQVRSSGGRVQGELIFDADRQYLGYRIDFETDERRFSVDVTGAASRMLPGNVFDADDVARLAVVDAKTAPPESGNVAPGFMATALQGSHLARHRATGVPPAYATPKDAERGAESVTRSFGNWVGSDMGRELAASNHPRIKAFREAWRQLPRHDLPDGPGAAAAPYAAVAERAGAVAAAAASSGRFAPEDVRALHAVAQRAGSHSARLSATGPGPAPRGRGTAASSAAAPGPRVATPPTSAPRGPGLSA
ncbi:hypothetical protein [Streptomyces sp. NPDC058623]|uniref:hypothetical protein n=1 Tax=Streptomyces sp. NPDC058623 TaxID=3346563 RepID=UPI003664B2F6